MTNRENLAANNMGLRRQLLQRLFGMLEGRISLQGFLISLNRQLFLSLLSVEIAQTVVKNRALRMQFHRDFQQRDGVIGSFGVTPALRIVIQVRAGDSVRVELQRFPKIIYRLSHLANGASEPCKRGFRSVRKHKIDSPGRVRAPVLRIKVHIELRGFQPPGAGLKARVPQRPYEIRVDVRAGKKLLEFFPNGINVGGSGDCQTPRFIVPRPRPVLIPFRDQLFKGLIESEFLRKIWLRLIEIDVIGEEWERAHRVIYLFALDAALFAQLSRDKRSDFEEGRIGHGMKAVIDGFESGLIVRLQRTEIERLIEVLEGFCQFLRIICKWLSAPVKPGCAVTESAV